MLLTCVYLFPSWAVSPPDAADASAARHLCWLRSARLVTVTCFSSSLEPSCFEVASLRPETVFARLPHFELMRLWKTSRQWDAPLVQPVGVQTHQNKPASPVTACSPCVTFKQQSLTCVHALLCSIWQTQTLIPLKKMKGVFSSPRSLRVLQTLL